MKLKLRPKHSILIHILSAKPTSAGLSVSCIPTIALVYQCEYFIHMKGGGDMQNMLAAAGAFSTVPSPLGARISR